MIGSSDLARAATYTQLASMERAGLPLLKAIEHVSRQGGAAATLLRPLQVDLNGGRSLPEALQRSAGFSRLEVAVLSAGAKAGSLPESLSQLAQTFESRAKVKRAIVGALAYPTLLLHAAIFLPSLALLIKEGVAGYLIAVSIPLGVLYGVVVGGFLLHRTLRKSQPVLLDSFVLALPVVGSVERKASLAYGFGALGLLYRNGVSLLEALETAAEVTPNAVVAATFRRCRDQMATSKSDLSEALAAEAGNLPPWALDLVTTGAASGQLDDMFASVTRRLDEEVATGIKQLVVALGAAVFMSAALFVAYKVISFWADYMGQLDRALGG